MTATALWIAGLALKATAVLVATWGLTALLRSRSPALRHLVWSAGIVAVLSLPLLSVSLPWRVEVATPVTTLPASTAAPVPVQTPVETVAPPPSAVDAADAPAALAPVTTTGPSLGFLLFVLWATVAAFALLRLLAGMLSVRHIVRTGTSLDDPAWSHPLMECADRLELTVLPRLVASDRAPMPFTGGLLHPFVVVPAGAEAWTDRRRRAVLSHELAHIRRRDLLVNTVAQLACAVWWFHPLVWVAAKRLRVESERACDNLVLGIGTRASEYADHLLQIVCGAGRGRTPALALPMAERREFEGRVLAILENDSPRHAPTRRLTAALAAGAALLVLPVAVLVPATAAPANPEPLIETAGITAALPATTTPPIETASARVEPATTPPQVPPAAASSLAQDAPQDTSRVVAALMRALGDSVAEVRENAAYALGQRKAEAAAAPLGRLLTSDPHPDVREMSAWSITQIGNLEGHPALIRALTTAETVAVRETAAWGLGQFHQPSSVEALTAALGDAAPPVRRTAAWALGQIRPRPAPEALIAAINDPSPESARLAIWAIGQTGEPRALQALTAAIGSPDREVRDVAMWALGQMRGPEAQDALIAATQSDDPAVRREAVRALAGRSGRPWPWPWPRPRNR